MQQDMQHCCGMQRLNIVQGEKLMGRETFDSTRRKSSHRITLTGAILGSTAAGPTAAWPHEKCCSVCGLPVTRPSHEQLLQVLPIAQGRHRVASVAKYDAESKRSRPPTTLIKVKLLLYLYLTIYRISSAASTS